MRTAGERLRLVRDAGEPPDQGRAEDPATSGGAPPGEAGAKIVPHVASLVACVRALVGNSHVVDDIVHETVAEALDSWQRYDATRDLGAWLRGIAAHVARHHWRKMRRGFAATNLLAQASREQPGGGPDPEADASGREQAALLLEAMDELTPALREAFVLRVVEGLPTDEVARMTGTSAAAVYTRVCKARARLVAAVDAGRRRRGKRRGDDDG